LRSEDCVFSHALVTYFRPWEEASFRPSVFFIPPGSRALFFYFRCFFIPGSHLVFLPGEVILLVHFLRFILHRASTFRKTNLSLSFCKVSLVSDRIHVFLLVPIGHEHSSFQLFCPSAEKIIEIFLPSTVYGSALLRSGAFGLFSSPFKRDGFRHSSSSDLASSPLLSARVRWRPFNLCFLVLPPLDSPEESLEYSSDSLRRFPPSAMEEYWPAESRQLL